MFRGPRKVFSQSWRAVCMEAKRNNSGTQEDKKKEM
jgi:hypothetical protein